MAPEFTWLAAGAVGYLVAMGCNPLRGFFADGFNLIRERGRIRLWVPVAALSLVPLAAGVLPGDRGGGAAREARASRVGLEVVEAAAADSAGLFSSVVGYRLPGQARELPVKVRAALTLAALLWAAAVVGVQFFILVALYLGVVMPERDPGWLGLLDFAWRRTLRCWPWVLGVAAFGAVPLWVPAGGLFDLLLWPAAALIAAVFAFVQVSLLSGERDFGDAVRANFQCWRKLPYPMLWFIAIAWVHLFLLHVSDALTSRSLDGHAALGWVWAGLVAFIRAGVLVWLLAALVLLFCTKTKNPSRRRIRP